MDADNAVDLGPQKKISRRRDRKPNSLMDPEDRHDHLWGLRNRRCCLSKPYERPKPEGFQERKRASRSRKNQNAVGPVVASPKMDSDEDDELLAVSEERQPNHFLNREGGISSVEVGSKRKKHTVVSYKKKPEVLGKKVGLDDYRDVVPYFFANMNVVSVRLQSLIFFYLHVMRRRWVNLLPHYQSKIKLSLKGPLELVSKESRPQERKRYSDWDYDFAVGSFRS